MKSYIRAGLFQLMLLVIFSASCSKTGGASAPGTGGSLARFAIVGDYLYVLDAHDIGVVDISHPEQPVRKGYLSVGRDLETIFPFKNKLYVGASNGMYIVSLADPEKPVNEGSITHFRACDPVVANDSVSYVTLRGGSSCGSTKNELNVYDSRTASNPQLVKEVPMTSPYGLGLLDNALYVCEGSNGLAVFDVSNSYNPIRIQTLKDDVYFDVIPYDKVLIAWTDAGVGFFDASDPLHIVKAGEIKE